MADVATNNRQYRIALVTEVIHAQDTRRVTPMLVERAADCMLSMITENDNLRATLIAARKELDRWGKGDMHYGPTPRDKGVVEALRLIDEALST